MSKRVRIGLIVVMLAACTKRDPSTDQLSKLKDQMCSCRDKACADGVQRSLMTWIEGQSTPPSEKQQELAFAIAACAATASKTAPAPTTSALASAEAPAPSTRPGSVAPSTPAQIAQLDRLAAGRATPKTANAFAERGTLFYVAGQEGHLGATAFERAIDDYSKALNLNPKLVGVLSNRGTAYVRLGNYDRAISDYDAAIEKAPRDAGLLAMRGGTNAKAGRDDKAIDDYSASLAIKDDETVRLNRANAYRRSGQKEKAISEYKLLTHARDPSVKQDATHDLSLLSQ